MTRAEADAIRACLCCGAPDAALLRLLDGRAWRACPDCAERCFECGRILDGAEARDPLPCEQRDVPVRDVTPRP